MIEYPSIQNSSKAPRKECVAFNKLDGSNFDPPNGHINDKTLYFLGLWFFQYKPKMGSPCYG